ncbi:hypothetical protein N7499_000935 [Penicillium canescens]|uniref:FHA domain-containing protein n=1 Tax=Penicillium canescens TaxID=5083 RepID=A0AAD6I1Y3_PENCN|nr:hypothetical protein N7522_004127 [Penicillium canescens]KAJ6027380.1 hypothetical protein N7460_012197 [Penicillium canescens]KAJ6040662.1 hypothetical protein N7444_009567 [Penicillium canescens]KAJ6101305.1 hypothetical protein N7499_000935 [Penicillium canescens]KAJ6173763.1 hypothetical protein N7485_006575 [Penicillium canescens]
MSDPQVSVTLIPLWDDTHPCRTLTLFDDDVPVPIGRASKREARNRSPAKDNGWFDSRVMSRDHALVSISMDRRNVYILDCGSTHGTYLNEDKLVTHVDTPLTSGDILRFGVDVDRGQEVFEALEVRCEVNWSTPQPEVVVESSDAITIKPVTTHSTNSFSVPEDYSDVEPEVVMLDSDDSKDSVARSWDTANPHAEEISPVSSVSENRIEVTEPVKSEVPGIPSSQTEEFTERFSGFDMPEKELLKMRARAAAIAQEASKQPVKPHQELAVPDEEIPGFHTTKMETFPPSCYQMLLDEEFSDWTMMKPLFMRLADMAWGVSDKIPDVDHVNKVIHSARRCSLAKSSYMVDDSPDFQPWNGTEVPWEFNSEEESDTTYHRVPGPALRYWFVDKRRFWILDGDEENDLRMSDWWWIVEKPWELLSEATKAEIATESHVDDCHKFWIVREWEPQMVGCQWYEFTPYWDSNFCEDLPSDDDSMDSDELDEEEGDLNDGDGDDSIYDRSDASDASDGSSILQEGHMEEFSVPWMTPFGQELDDEDDEDDSEYDSDDSNEEGSSEDDESEDKGSENEDDEDEDNSESEDEVENDTCPEEAYIRRLTKFMDVASSMPNFYPGNNDSGSSLPTPTSPCPERPEATTVLDSKAAKQPVCRPVTPKLPELPCVRDIPENASVKETLTTPTSPAMINPAAQFPNSAVSSELPSSCQSILPQARLSALVDQSANGSSMSHSYPLLAPWHPASKEGMPYADGPFRSPQKDLKRTATQMESSSNDFESQSLSQDAQRPQPLESYSQDTDLNTIPSAEVRDAIISALSENEPPTKRVKSNHLTPSKNLASHAATAVVGAILGGLGTIAMLATLPPDYFH